MSDSLITDLSRSPDADLRRVGEALAPLSPRTDRGVAGPRASETLAEFLAVPQASGVREEIGAPVPAPDLVIQLGGPVSATRRRGRRLRLPGLLGGGLFAKAVLGSAVVLAAGAGLAAVTGPLGHDTVVVTPTSPTPTSAPTAPMSPAADDGHEGRAHFGDADDGIHQRTPEAPRTTKTTAPAQPGTGQERRRQASDSEGESSGSGSDGGASDERGDDDSDESSDDGSEDGSDESNVDPASGDAESRDRSSSGPSGTDEDAGGSAAND